MNAHTSNMLTLSTMVRALTLSHLAFLAYIKGPAALSLVRDPRGDAAAHNHGALRYTLERLLASLPQSAAKRQDAALTIRSARRDARQSAVVLGILAK